jgi:hypothetical protein
MHLSLLKLVLWGASVVGVTILIGLALLAALGLFRNL